MKAWELCPHGNPRAEDEVVFLEFGLVGVLQPHKPAISGVGIGDSAHLYPTPVWDLGGCSNEGIVVYPPPVPFLLSFPPLSSFFSHTFTFGAGVAFIFGGGVLLGGGGSALEEEGEEDAMLVEVLVGLRLPVLLLSDALPPLFFFFGGGGGF